MALGSAEQQEWLQRTAELLWARKDYAEASEAREAAKRFRKFLGAAETDSLRLFSRKNSDGGIALLAMLPWPLSGQNVEALQGWRSGNDDAEQLDKWRIEI